MNPNQLVAVRTRELRLSKNITLEATAKGLSISRIENGHVEISAKKIILLAELLQIPAALFFDGIVL